MADFDFDGATVVIRERKRSRHKRTTRVPTEMAELLDDLVYTSQQEGTPRTKPEPAHEALRDLLRKYTII